MLNGGAGDNQFIFLAPADGGDVVQAFGTVIGKDDVIAISRKGFGAGLDLGTLPQGRYHEGATNRANDANCRFVLRTGDDTL